MFLNNNFEKKIYFRERAQLDRGHKKIEYGNYKRKEEPI